MKPETSAALKVIAFGCGIIFLVFLGLSAPFYMRQRQVLKNWPRTEAKVLVADVVAVPGKRSTYIARFFVEYRLGDAVLSATATSGYGDRFRSRAQSWADRFPVGGTVPIAYDPLNPTNIRLDPGYNRFFFGAPLLITEFGLGFGAVAILLYGIARRSERATRSSVSSTK